ncbi:MULTISPECIES: hypothetical protein [unclassified Sphingopyxis]|uniref:hypothetical protein n=1 Tax=unclassified Sphingopyxis TaxID=2614943 RepID=UPI00285B5095|nr:MULTISPECIES: hypothetical protein [unclassified Sphingopyxis]MDR7061987.1 hypothetical protein [Sphingopyxis sp. BE235]MDR7182446.1 hypothetical protein [Sphingopyxis sp. BE249]
MKKSRLYAGLALSAPLFVGCWALATFVRRLPEPVTKWLLAGHRELTRSRGSDVRIPKDLRTPAYMRRWWRFRQKWFGSIYYHIIHRSDDDRALHDHPFWSFSIVLEGGYHEHIIHEGGLHERRWCPPGSMTFRWTGRKAHRLELKRVPVYHPPAGATMEQEARTIFITGPAVRRWGFHDPHRGWVEARNWEAHCAKHGIMPGTSPFY